MYHIHVSKACALRTKANDVLVWHVKFGTSSHLSLSSITIVHSAMVAHGNRLRVEEVEWQIKLTSSLVQHTQGCPNNLCTKVGCRPEGMSAVHWGNTVVKMSTSGYGLQLPQQLCIKHAQMAMGIHDAHQKWCHTYCWFQKLVLCMTLLQENTAQRLTQFSTQAKSAVIPSRNHELHTEKMGWA
jgi:hypothetical protein